MRRHKPIAATIQLNLRVTPLVFRELETRAKAHGITVSELVRRALDAGNQSLSAYLNSFEQRMRDAVERSAHNSPDPEPVWRRLATFGALLRKVYTDCEELFLPDMADSEVRALLRGAPADETKH
jgi:hypothetical protein